MTRLWPTALRAGLLLTILATGTTAVTRPIRFSAQLLLIVMVLIRKG